MAPENRTVGKGAFRRMTEGCQARKKRKLSDELKARIALEVLPGDKTIRETAARRQACPNQAGARKRWAADGKRRHAL